MGQKLNIVNAFKWPGCCFNIMFNIYNHLYYNFHCSICCFTAVVRWILIAIHGRWMILIYHNKFMLYCQIKPEYILYECWTNEAPLHEKWLHFLLFALGLIQCSHNLAVGFVDKPRLHRVTLDWFSSWYRGNKALTANC